MLIYIQRTSEWWVEALTSGPPLRQGDGFYNFYREAMDTLVSLGQ